MDTYIHSSGLKIEAADLLIVANLRYNKLN
jgi:hypothetical protein